MATNEAQQACVQTLSLSVRKRVLLSPARLMLLPSQPQMKQDSDNIELISKHRTLRRVSKRAQTHLLNRLLNRIQRWPGELSRPCNSESSLLRSSPLPRTQRERNTHTCSTPLVLSRWCGAPSQVLDMSVQRESHTLLHALIYTHTPDMKQPRTPCPQLCSDPYVSTELWRADWGVTHA